MIGDVMETFIVLMNIALTASLIFLIERLIQLMNSTHFLISELQHYNCKNIIESWKEEKKL